MKSLKYSLLAAACIIAGSSSGYAQFVVATPDADALLGTIIAETTAINTTLGAQLTAANTTLRVVATDTTGMLTMFRLPTPGVVPALAGIDGGGLKEAGGDAVEYNPLVLGATSMGTGRILKTADETAVKLALAKALLKGGNPADEQAQTQMTAATNYQAEAYSDMLVYATRFASAEKLLAQLPALDIKQAAVWSVGLQVAILQQLSLIGQSISHNTAATAETWLDTAKRYLLYKQDHELAAKSFKIP